MTAATRTARLTEDSQFPITRKWARTSSSRIVSGDYTIIRSEGFRSDVFFTLRYQGKTLNVFARQMTAKVGAEKHAAGFDPEVSWYNMPEPK